jgi:ABC-type spermidine/putrescine transport system permease subunit II
MVVKNIKSMKINYNTLTLGLTAGLFAPVLIFLGFYFIKFNQMPFVEFLKTLITKDIIVPIISLCVIVNLGLFFLFLQTHRYYSARGIIMATFIYAIAIVIFKFI